jgi:hypothetical protein
MSKEKIDIFDLESSALHKFENLIIQLGGRYSLSEKLSKRGVGISGLAYNSLQNENKFIDTGHFPLRVNLELIKSGMVFYLRNRSLNYGFIIKNSLISHLSIEKKNDLIAEGKIYLFHQMIKLGYDYLISRNMILETDKVEFNPILFKIHLHDGQTINFEIDKFNPKGVIKFLTEKCNFKVEVSIEGFTLVPNI